MSKKLFITGLLAAGVLAVAQAQIVTYNTAGLAGNEASVSPTTATGVVAQNLTRGTGLVAQTTSGSLNSSDWFPSNNTNTTFSTGRYYTFTVAPSANYALSFTNVSGSVAVNNTSNAPDQAQWAYSINNYATGLGSAVTPGTSSTSVSATLTNTGITTATTFRLIGWKATGATNTGRQLRIISPSVSGSATLRSAGTLTWDGGQGANWGTYDAYAANQSSWNSNNIPTSALVDSLNFAGSTQTATNNNIAGLTIGSISFAAGASAFTNSGNSITLNGGVTNNSSSTETIGHGIVLSAVDHTFDAISGNINVSGNISGSGSISKTGSGTLVASGTNSFNGLTVTEGEYSAGSASALGNGAVVVNGSTAVLSTTGNVSGAASLSLMDGTVTPGGNSSVAMFGLTGSFTMTGGTLEMNVGSSFDSIYTTGGTFSISSGILSLVPGVGLDYGSHYLILSGFSSGSVSGLTINGYDNTNYIAVLGSNGELSFTAVPEAREFAMGVAALLLCVAGFRRLRRVV